MGQRKSKTSYQSINICIVSQSSCYVRCAIKSMSRFRILFRARSGADVLCFLGWSFHHHFIQYVLYHKRCQRNLGGKNIGKNPEVMEDYIAAIIGIAVILVFFLILLIVLIIAIGLWFSDFPNKDRYVNSDVQLDGKTAIVIAAYKGIGAATAKELARRGARVILAVRNVKKTEPIRDEIVRETKNDEVKIMQVDLPDLESVHIFCFEFNESDHICTFFD